MAEPIEKVETEVLVPEVDEQPKEDIDPSESVEAEKDVLAKIEEHEADKTEGPSEGILQKIKNKLLGKETPEEDATGHDIPEDFTTAASEAGWSEEDIIKFASDYNDDELKEMISYLESPDEEEVEEEKVVVKPKEEVKVDKPVENEEVKKLKEELAELKKSIDEVKESKKEKETQAMGDQAETFLDKTSEKFDVFGKAKDLPKFPDGRLIPNSPQYKARAELLGNALKFYTMGESWDGALENALSMYKGKYLERDTERRVIQNLRRKSEKLSPDRYTKITEKKYKDETERQADVVKTATKKAEAKKFD